MRTLIKLSSASEIDLSRWGLKTFCVCSHQVDNIIKWQPNAFGSWLPNRFKLASTFAESIPPTAPPPRRLSLRQAKQRAELRAEVQILLCGGIICSTSVCTRKTFAPFLLSARRLKWKSRAKRARKGKGEGGKLSPNHVTCLIGLIIGGNS